MRALNSERSGRDVDSRLAGLVRKELIRPYPATIPGDEAFRFRHLLIGEAAYEGLPKPTRADLHERLGRWLEHSAGELVERDEIAGWHLEQAVRYRHALSRGVDASLARDAALHLHAGAPPGSPTRRRTPSPVRESLSTAGSACGRGWVVAFLHWCFRSSRPPVRRADRTLRPSPNRHRRRPRTRCRRLRRRRTHRRVRFP